MGIEGQGPYLSHPGLYDEQMETLNLEAPAIFLRLANHYHLKPERLADALIFEFCCSPPRELILVAREAQADRAPVGVQ